MRYDELRELIQPHLKVPVEDVYADFRTATGKDDADNFLAYLQDREKAEAAVRRSDSVLADIKNEVGTIRAAVTRLIG